MTSFQYYFHQLPCFDCKKNNGKYWSWLVNACDERDAIAQLTATLAPRVITPDLSANVVVLKIDSWYLLLNFFGYSEEELAKCLSKRMMKEVADEIEEATGRRKDTITFRA